MRNKLFVMILIIILVVTLIQFLMQKRWVNYDL